MLDIEFFEKLKDIIKQLVKVNPKDRMNLSDAREKILELEGIANQKKTQFENFLKLDQYMQKQKMENGNFIPIARTEKPTQISYGLMHALKSEKCSINNVELSLIIRFGL